MQKYSKSVLLICPWMVCGVTSGAGLGLGWGSETLPSSAKYVKGTSSLYQVTNLINFLPSYQDNVLMWYVLKAIQKKIYDEHNIKMWDRGGVHSLLSQAPTWLSTALLTVGFANSSATEVLGEANFRPSHRVFTTSATQRSINHLLNPTPGTTLCMRIRSSYKEQRVQSSRTLKQKVSALTDEGRQAECAVVASWPRWVQSHSLLILHSHQYVVSTSCSEKLLLHNSPLVYLCVIFNTLHNVMWQPGWKGSLGENGDLDMNGWIPSLPTWNYHNIVNRLYFSAK